MAPAAAAVALMLLMVVIVVFANTCSDMSSHQPVPAVTSQTP